VKVEEERPITQPNTLERQQALAEVHSHGGRFHVTGGMHVTANDFYISHEIGKNRAACAALEKEKELRQQLQLTEEKANAILAQGKSVDSLTVTELDTLLAWHRAAKIKGVKWVDKVKQWRQIMSSGKRPPDYDWWTAEDEERLTALQGAKVDIGDTQYGGELALRERELMAAADRMSREKRAALRQKLDEMDAEEALNALMSVNGEEPAHATTASEAV
jgi:hypothetical protein